MSHQRRAAEKGEGWDVWDRESKTGVELVTACVLMGSDVRLGQGWPLALVLCGWQLIFWSERVFGSVSRVGRRETRSFRNPLCCCGWPTTIHSLIQDLLNYSSAWRYWLCHNYNQAFIFIFFIASSLTSTSLLFHTGAIIQFLCMCLKLEAVQMYVCVRAGAPLFLLRLYFYLCPAHYGFSKQFM